MAKLQETVKELTTKVFDTKKIAGYTAVSLGVLAIGAGPAAARSSIKDNFNADRASLRTQNHKGCQDIGFAALCFWKIYNVKNMSGTVQGAYRFCVSNKKSKLAQHIDCDITKSSSVTVTAQVGGEAVVPYAVISASVGYQVTQTNQASGSDVVDVPPNISEEILWAPIFGNRKYVTEELEECYSFSPGVYNVCIPESPQDLPSKDIKHAITEQYVGPTYDPKVL